MWQIKKHTQKKLMLKKQKQKNNEKTFFKSFRKHNYYYGNEMKWHYPKSNFIHRCCRYFEEHRNDDEWRDLSGIQLREVERQHKKQSLKLEKQKQKWESEIFQQKTAELCKKYWVYKVYTFGVKGIVLNKNDY